MPPTDVQPPFELGPASPAPARHVLSLAQFCHRELASSQDVDGVPFHALRPVLDHCTAHQLARFEKLSPSIAQDDDDLWRVLCIRDFTGIAHEIDPSSSSSSSVKADADGPDLSEAILNSVDAAPPDDSGCTSWRAYYQYLLHNSESRFAQASSRMRASRDEERAAKRQKTVQEASQRDLQLLRGRGPGVRAPQTLLEKARYQARQRLTAAHRDAAQSQAARLPAPPRGASVAFGPAPVTGRGVQHRTRVVVTVPARRNQERGWTHTDPLPPPVRSISTGAMSPESSTSWSTSTASSMSPPASMSMSSSASSMSPPAASPPGPQAGHSSPPAAPTRRHRAKDPRSVLFLPKKPRTQQPV
ncbi:RNA polymerase II transcription factor SIII subunit A-domain-containing protein [Auriculariales sp. MPI-PUGE-AT-0066]|nr:RNA polymerase II transcription factor SIII subunit A-domain-containing protein [Auriculariales sp. MPI-PUGE-AT-0066]